MRIDVKKSRLILVSFVITLFLASVSYAVNTSVLANDYTSKSIQVFTPPATNPIVTVSADSDVDVSSYRVIMFDADETIYYGSYTTKTYDLPKNTPLGISKGVTTIHISADASMIVM